MRYVLIADNSLLIKGQIQKRIISYILMPTKPEFFYEEDTGWL